MEEGSVTTIVDNETAVKNLFDFAAGQGYKASRENNGELFHITIQKQGAAAASRREGDLVITITSDQMGTGDRDFGESLMKSYIYALTEADMKPKSLIFINSGVNLTTEGSPVIESLRTLEAQGVEILSCGACLDFYGLSEKLAIGTVSNMYNFVEKMNNAGNTVRF